jgi:hypothetical protein
MIASQIRNYLLRARGGILEDPGTAVFFRDRIFEAGASLPWHRVVERATAEPLNPRYHLRDVLEGPKPYLPEASPRRREPGDAGTAPETGTSIPASGR